MSTRAVAGEMAQAGTSVRAQTFCIPATREFKKFKQIILYKIGFECPPPPHGILTTETAFIKWQSAIHRFWPPPNILRQKAKSNHQGDSNEPPTR